MISAYDCPECGHDHSEPADARFVLAVLCMECEMAIALDELASERRIPLARIVTERAAA